MERGIIIGDEKKKEKRSGEKVRKGMEKNEINEKREEFEGNKNEMEKKERMGIEKKEIEKEMRIVMGKKVKVDERIDIEEEIGDI